MELEKPYFFHAIKVDDETCMGCSHCMNDCPTEAIRIWNGKAIIDENKCVDCGLCYSVCPVNAIYISQDPFEILFNYKYRVALFPAVFIGQFPDEVKPNQVYSAMLEMGFTHLFEVESAAGLLHESILEYQKTGDSELPIISSFCPAIVRLIQVKFPSLVDNILKLATPSDIGAMFYRKKFMDQGIDESEIGIFYITPCAAKTAAIQSPVGEDKSYVNGAFNLDTVFSRVYRQIKHGSPTHCIVPEYPGLADFEILWTLTRGESSNVKGRNLAIDGIHSAMEFLEMVENEEVTGIDFLECRACKEGCAGGILNPQNRFLTVEQLNKRAFEAKKLDVKSGIGLFEPYQYYLKQSMVLKNITPRSMMMLDADMAQAMLKMKEASRIELKLPGIDCGACGAPSCKALSEDIVKGNATLSHCVFMQKVLVKNGDIDMNTAFSIIDKIWGDKVVKGILPDKKK